MFHTTKDTLLYVLCPGYYKTGGTELAHQLVSEVNSQGGKAYIVYYDNAEKGINPEFTKYTNNFITLKDVVDNKDNIIIAPEIIPEILNSYKHIQKSVWWMSVDNFTKNRGLLNVLKYYGVLNGIKLILRGKATIVNGKIDKKIAHLYQSEYAKIFLKKRGASRIARLSDYINDIYIDKHNSQAKKEDVVLYNPKKGYAITKKIIKNSPDITWIPLQNMTNTQVCQLLHGSKVYIDFGNHPGKDRFPREAAISGCSIITNKNGSAANDVDIPINDNYKFDKPYNIQKITAQIRTCLNDYDRTIADFNQYRQTILNEKRIFKEDVNKLFITK